MEAAILRMMSRFWKFAYLELAGHRPVFISASVTGLSLQFRQEASFRSALKGLSLHMPSSISTP